MTEKNRLLAAFLVSVAGLFAATAAPADNARILQTAVSPDGRWQVELADYAQPLKFELWTTPVSGGERQKIGGIVPFDNDVSEFLISSDSTRVVYRQGRTATGDWLLYSTPIYNQSGHRICQTMTLGGAVEHGIFPVLDGNYVRYRADPYVDEQYLWFVVPVGGGTILNYLFANGFESGGIEAWQ
ncbi:MAG: hypothetical protein ABI689_02525 [Thermoanaerobaculia bacterium]